MSITICPNGHHYNTDDNPTCPYCEKVKSRDIRIGWYNPDSDSLNDIPKTEPIYGIHDEPMKTVPLTPQDDKTQIAFLKEDEPQPVVGWLVCIEGPDKGIDFCLQGVKSTIGRRKDSSVCLSDPRISRDGFPALVVYDDRKSHRFYLANGDSSSQNTVELQGNMLLGQSILNAYDKIRIEDTVLMFVPFCGEDFYWED